MPAEHKFLKFILPTRMFEAIRKGTREWLAECPCGHKRDLWDIGGVRHKGFGEPRQYRECPKCEQATWHKVRCKTEVEKMKGLEAE